MRKPILDSTKLIRHWRLRRARQAAPLTQEVVERWAGELVSLYQTDAIVTPVAIEFLAGFTAGAELRLAEAFLACFVCLDNLDIREADWRKVYHIARRIPPDGKPRQLGDCLIAALASRLGCKVISDDQGFPRLRS